MTGIPEVTAGDGRAQLILKSLHSLPGF